MDALAIGLQNGAQERAGRSFAVRARNMEHRGKLAMRVAQPSHHRGDCFESKTPLRNAEFAQPIQLSLHAGIVGVAKIHRQDA